MATTISISLQKGGSGKTTTAQALASTFGNKGYKVLLVDMDSQANATTGSGCDPKEGHTVIDLLAEDCSSTDAIIPCELYDLLPSDNRLSNLDTIENMDFTVLKTALDAFSDNYDFIVIDTPPQLGNLLKICLMASDYLIIPVESRPYSLNGLDKLYDTVKAVQSQNKGLSILGILLIKYNPRTVLNRQIEAFLEEKAMNLHTTVFNTKIREGIAVPEAQMMGEPLITYAPKSKPNLDYVAFTDEVLKRIGG